MGWLESLLGSLLGSGVLLAAFKSLWNKIADKDKALEDLAAAKDKIIADKDKEIAALNLQLQFLSEKRISDLREMLKPEDSEPSCESRIQVSLPRGGGE